MIFKKKNRSTEMREHFSNPLFSIGSHSYGEPKILSFDKQTQLRIGRYCSFSDNVTILLGGNHRLDWITTYPFPVFKDVWPEAADISGHPASHGDISIGNDVWIGYGATILSGVSIGDGSVIGAKALISKDVAAYEVVAGNPAKVVKKRFDEEHVALLLKLAWWDWPEEKIRSNIHILCSPELKNLVKLL